MGNKCCSSEQKVTTKLLEQKKEICQKEFPLHFRVKLKNFKGKTLKKTDTKIIVEFCENRYESKFKYNSPDPDYEINEEFELHTSTTKISTQTLSITVIGAKKNKPIGRLKLSLFDIANGPSHFDFNIPSGSSFIGRLNFDIKMDQKIHIGLVSNKLICKLDKVLTEKLYVYQMILMKGEQRIPSEFSGDFVNMYLNRANINKNDYDSSSNNVVDRLSEFTLSRKTSYANDDQKRTIMEEDMDDDPTKGMDSSFDKSLEDSDGYSITKTFVSEKKVAVRGRLTKRKTVIIKYLEDLKENSSQENEFSMKLKPVEPLAEEEDEKDGALTYKTDKTNKTEEEEQDAQTAQSNSPLTNAQSRWKFLRSKVRQKTRNTKKDFEKLNEAVHHRKLIWNDPEGIKIDINLFLMDIRKCNLQISMFQKKDRDSKRQRGNSSPEPPKLRRLGQTYISLSEAVLDSCKPGFEENKALKSFSRKVWVKGRPIGEIKGEINIETTPFLKQMMCGVLTEKGVAKTSSVIRQDSSQFKVKLHPKIEKIKEWKDALNDKAFAVLGLASNNPLEADKFEMNNYLTKLQEILKESRKESLKSFIYEGRGEMLKAQEVLLETGSHLVEYCMNVEESLRENYYKTLHDLLSRGELYLENVGFNAQQKTEIVGRKKHIESNKELSYKLKIALKYQRFLYECLWISMDLFEQKALQPYERQFIEFCLATCYFRVPEFRESLLENLRSIQRVRLEEWNAMRQSYDENFKKNTFKKSATFGALSDWNNDFYTPIDWTDEYEFNMKRLKEKIYSKEWKRRFGKKGTGFFFFVKELCQYVHRVVVVREAIDWTDIPGYGIILKTLLVELKEREVRYYPDALLDAVNALLLNNDLLEIFTGIIIKKTNANDYVSVSRCFEILDSWFKRFDNESVSFFDTFNFYHIIKAFTICLERDHCISISKALWFIYKHIAKFPDNTIAKICKILFSKHFMILFCHWSHTVRSVFHHMLLFRFFHLYGTIRFKQTNTRKLRKQLSKLIDENNEESLTNLSRILNDLVFIKINKFMFFLSKANESYMKLENRRKLLRNTLNTIERRRSRMALQKEFRKLNFAGICARIKTSDDEIRGHMNSFLGREEKNHFDQSQLVTTSSNMSLILMSKHSNSDLDPLKNNKPRFSSFEDIKHIHMNPASFSYVRKSFKELKKVELSYQKWRLGFDEKLREMKEQSLHFKEICARVKVPDIDVKIPRDEFEGVENDDPDEW